MGTRSLTFVYDEPAAHYEHCRPIINMYAQYDGYPEGHGRELAEFLTPLTLVNGLGRDTANLANGMGCLAAQLVARFKVGCGGHYLYPTTVKDCGQDFEYHIYANRVVVKNYEGKELFRGSWAEFANFCSAKEIA
jgi:hypothetical protein